MMTHAPIVHRRRWRIAGVTACLAAAVLTSSAALGAQAAPSQPVAVSDSTAIVSVLAGLNAAWRAGDAARWVAAYAPDARFVNVAGMRMAAREALRVRMAAIFTGMFRGSVRETRLEGLRWLRPDVALVEEDVVIRGYAALPAGVAPTEPGVLRTRISHVFVRRDARWTIVATHNTAVAPVRQAARP